MSTPAVMPLSPPTSYQPQRPSRSLHLALRGGTHHVRLWGEPAQATPERPPLVLAHGWMDVGASFQFLVDELAQLEGTGRCILALDWRGFGLSAGPAGADAYWFPDYLGDLEAILRAPELGLDAVHPIIGINDQLNAHGHFNAPTLPKYLPQRQRAYHLVRP